MIFGSTIVFLRRLGTWLIWVLVVCGLILRVTVQDRLYLLHLIYYVTPIPMLPLWMLLAGLVGRPPLTWHRNAVPTPKSWRSPARVNLVLGLGFLVWTFASECPFRALPARKQDLRFVFWNVARVSAGVERIAAQLKSYEPQVIGLVEADERTKHKTEDWQRELSEYQIIRTIFGGHVAVKGEVLTQRNHRLGPESWCEQVELRIDQVEFTLLLVDVTSALFRLRSQPLQALAKLADELNDRPMIIMGDFNTPDDSVWLSDLRLHHRHAFRERGTGYAATWPNPLPVLTIDHVWVNERFEVTQCRHGWTIDSDHRPIVTEVSIR